MEKRPSCSEKTIPFHDGLDYASLLLEERCNLEIACPIGRSSCSKAELWSVMMSRVIVVRTPRFLYGRSGEAVHGLEASGYAVEAQIGKLLEEGLPVCGVEGFLLLNRAQVALHSEVSAETCVYLLNSEGLVSWSFMSAIMDVVRYVSFAKQCPG